MGGVKQTKAWTNERMNERMNEWTNEPNRGNGIQFFIMQSLLKSRKEV